MIKCDGRDKELKETYDLLFSDSTGTFNILVITGEPGIGKTSLAYTLSSRAAEEKKFERTLEKSAYLKNWTRLILELIRDLQITVPLKANLAELKEAIVQSAKEKPILLLLDNLPDIDRKSIEFMRLWSTSGRLSSNNKIGFSFADCTIA